MQKNRSLQLVLIILLLKSCSSNNDNKLIEKCINKIYAKYMDHKYQTLYMHADSEQQFINFDFPTVTYSNKKKLQAFEHFKKFDAFIITLTEDALIGVYEYLVKLDTWNPRARAIVVYEGDVNTFFKTIVKYHIYNTVVLKKLDDYGQDIYTYFPYEFENYNQPFVEPVILGACINGTIDEAIDLYPNKLKTLWRNSSAMVSYMPLYPYVICAACGTGIEVVLAKMLSTKLKFALNFDQIQYNNWGAKMPNGTYIGAIRALQTRRADFVIGQFHLRERDHLIDFDCTFSHMDDDLTWAVPSAKLLSHWSNLVHIFEAQAWIFIFTSLAIAAIFWVVVGKITETGYFRTYYVIEVPFMLLLLISLPHTPKSFYTKILYVSTWSFGFIVIAVWNSYLIFYLTHQTFEKQIANTRELVASGLILGIHPELAKMYGDSESDVGKTIYRTYYQCDASYTCLDRTGFKRDMATITTTRIFKYILPEKYQNAKGRNIIDLIKEAVVKDYTVMYFQKGHPLYERINELLIQIRGGGFITYLDQHTDYTNALIHKSDLFGTTLFETSTLTMQEMQGPFYLLAIGFITSFLVFASEFWVFKRNSKKVNMNISSY